MCKGWDETQLPSNTRSHDCVAETENNAGHTDDTDSYTKDVHRSVGIEQPSNRKALMLRMAARLTVSHSHVRYAHTLTRAQTVSIIPYIHPHAETVVLRA